MIFQNQKKKLTGTENNSEVTLKEITTPGTQKMCFCGTRAHFKIWAQVFAGLLLIASVNLLIDVEFSLFTNTNRSYFDVTDMSEEAKMLFFHELSKEVFDGSSCLLGMSIALLIFVWIHKDNSVLLVLWAIGQGYLIAADVIFFCVMVVVNIPTFDASSISIAVTVFLHVIFQIGCFCFNLAYRFQWIHAHGGITDIFINANQEQNVVVDRDGVEKV